MKENEIKNAIEVFEKPSKHIKCVHKCENGMEFLTYSQYLVSAFETAIEGLKELEQYRAIGTVEECRKVREKQIPKKTIKDICDRDSCPECGWIIGYDDTVQPYCHNCGQALNWSEIE